MNPNGQFPADFLWSASTSAWQFEGGALDEGADADLAVLDLNRPHMIDSGTFRSLGRATPFDGWGVSAAVAMTICGGEIVYHDLPTREA